MAITNIKRYTDLTTGSITLEESLNDYPNLTVTTYTSDSFAGELGDIYSWGGLTFYLDNFSIEKLPMSIPYATNQITYNYIHIVKKILELPINLRNFINTYKNAYVRKNDSSYWYPSGLLATYAQSIAVGGSIAIPSFLIEVSKNPGVSDTITLKEFIDDRIAILGLVYNFSGSNLSFVPLGTGGSVSGDAVSNITVSYGSVPGYKNTYLSWSNKDNYESIDLLKKKYIELKDNQYVLYEGDYNPHLPPPEADKADLVPKDLSVMIDSSGLTKSCKITKYKWDQPELEITATFGFAHAALELIGDPERPNSTTDTVLQTLSDQVIESGNALQEVLGAIQSGKFGYPDDAAFDDPMIWRLVSIKQTSYIYENLTYNIKPVIETTDINNNKSYKPISVPAKYEKYLKSNLQILVREESVGWELKRFAQEDATNWANGSIESWLSLDALVKSKDVIIGSGDAVSKLNYYLMLYKAKITLEQYLFRRIPLFERIDYSIIPYSKFYKDADEVDWSVVDIPKYALDGVDESEPNKDETIVQVLFPDPNWKPLLMIQAKSRYKSSYGSSGNPNYDPYARNYYGSNPVSVSTGTEEYEYTKYTVLPSKNTRKELGTLYNNYVQLKDVFDAIDEDVEFTGTYYTDKHPYLHVSDYGTLGIENPTIKTSQLRTNPPRQIKYVEDKYNTLNTIRVAQDNSYKSYLTTKTVTTAEGRPPQATIRKPIFEEDKEDKTNSVYYDTATFLTSSITSKNSDIIPSVSINAAENIMEALDGAKFKLVFDILQSGGTVSAQLDFNATPKKSIINGYVGIPGVSGNWVIKRSTQSIQYGEGNAYVQNLDIEAGLLSSPNVVAQTIQLENRDKVQDSVKILIDANFPNLYGTPIESIPEGFGRWLDIGS